MVWFLVFVGVVVVLSSLTTPSSGEDHYQTGWDEEDENLEMFMGGDG